MYIRGGPGVGAGTELLAVAGFSVVAWVLARKVIKMGVKLLLLEAPLTSSFLPARGL